MADQVEVKQEPLSDSEEAPAASAAAAATSAPDAGDAKKDAAAAAPVEVKQERTEDFDKLISYGLDHKVASRLDDIYKTGKLTHSDLDERALDALKEFPTEGALAVLAQFLESNLEHVSNKSAYLCGVMKTYRQKSRGANGAGGAAAGLLNGGASSNGASNGGGSGAGSVSGGAKGPDEAKIKEILDRTGYTLDVTTGQRKYGGPPPEWEGDAPGNGCEVFCGKIPRDLYEDELIPLFEKCGTIWDLRLMMDPMTGLNRGYAFVTFTEREAAQEAVRQLDSYDLGEGKTLKVNVSEPKTRLFIGNIPKSKGRDEIDEEFKKLSAGLREVIIYSSPDDKKKNRGFCFLEYESHKAASLAKRRLETGRVKVWSCDIIVDWADPQEEPDQETMSQVKVLYVRNLTAAVTEEKLRETFEEHGKVERVKKIKDYAFVHFEDRKQACAAMKELNKKDLLGSDLEISLAKPPSDKKKKEEMLRKREQRMMKSMAHGMALPHFPPFPAAFGPMGAAAGMYRGNPGGPRGQMGGARMQRGYENGFYAWGWGGDANWNHHQGHHHHHHHLSGGHQPHHQGGGGGGRNNHNGGGAGTPRHQNNARAKLK